MSYILDALKKSDQERKQGNIPDLQTVHVPVSVESAPVRWHYGMIIFLMLSLAFVLGTLRPWESELVTQVNQQSDKAVELQALVPARLPVEQKEKVANIPEENSSRTNHTQQQIKSSATIKQTVTGEAPSLDIDSVPHLYDMPSLVQQAIPDMVFAGHVFSSNIEQRSVIINNHYMNEGDVVIDGLKIEQITQKGIVFNYNAQLFRMDVLQDWSFD